MVRLRMISKLLVYVATILVSFVCIVHIIYLNVHDIELVDQRKPDEFQHLNEENSESQDQNMDQLEIKCPESATNIEELRSKSIIRAILLRYPSDRADYYFVQFRWFYRSWIEAETFSPEPWRSDIIVFIDNDLKKSVLQKFEELNCQLERIREDRKQASRCILTKHQYFQDRSSSERKSYLEKFQFPDEITQFDEQIDRLLAFYQFNFKISQSQPKLYDMVLGTTMNTFLTTQFGKYVPLKCGFLIGSSPDFTTWFSKVDYTLDFLETLLKTLKVSQLNDQIRPVISYDSTIQRLKKKYRILFDQLDISTDSSRTTYRTSIYHLKCYAHSTSLFSERMFRENAYDGFEKQPFNIFIAREYATLIALQSKVMTLEELRALATNVTSRTS